MCVRVRPRVFVVREFDTMLACRRVASVHHRVCFCCVQREITRKLTFPKQPTNPFLEMVKFLLERIAPVHIDSEAIRSAQMTLFNRTGHDIQLSYGAR